MFDRALNTSLFLILPKVSATVFIKKEVVCFSLAFVENLYLPASSLGS